MSLDDLVSVTITRNSKTPTRKGFGTPLLVASSVPSSWGGTPVKSFSKLSDVTDAGFATTTPIYKMAAIFFSASPAVKKIKIGKRSLPPTKSIKLTVTNITEGFIYNFSVNGTALTYTVLASATTTTVATALAALIDALPVVAATSSVAVITITASAGVLFDVAGWRTGGNGMTMLDNTSDPGIATDLAAFQSYDSDWYGLIVDSAGKAEHAAVDAWVEANEKIYAGDTCDSANMDSGSTTDILYTAKGLSYSRSGFWHSTENLLHWTSCGIMGSRLTATPGSDTWKFKSLPGIAPSVMTDAEKSAVLAKNGNTYTTVLGANITEDGKTAVGEFYDVIRFIDWLKSEIQTIIFAAMINAPKIPFTDAGVDTIKGLIMDRLKAGVKSGGLSPNPPPTVDAPLVKDVATLDKATRNLPDVTFTGVLAGAIHSLVISGTLSV